jgi:hypothetical protein
VFFQDLFRDVFGRFADYLKVTYNRVHGFII